MSKEIFKKYWYLFLIVLLLFAVVVMIGLNLIFPKPNSKLALQYSSLRRLPLSQNIGSLLDRPLTVRDVNAIQYWMTFDYLNKIFNLPPNYLQGALNISDKRYPFLTLARYAREDRLNAALVLSEVQAAIIDYLTVPKP